MYKDIKFQIIDKKINFEQMDNCKLKLESKFEIIK